MRFHVTVVGAHTVYQRCVISVYLHLLENAWGFLSLSLRSRAKGVGPLPVGKKSSGSVRNDYREMAFFKRVDRIPDYVRWSERGQQRSQIVILSIQLDVMKLT